jgi:hypothetical protein
MRPQRGEERTLRGDRKMAASDTPATVNQLAPSFPNSVYSPLHPVFSATGGCRDELTLLVAAR